MKTYGEVNVHWIEVSGQLYAPATLPEERAPSRHW
jgi:hypothetical protein